MSCRSDSYLLSVCQQVSAATSSFWPVVIICQVAFLVDPMAVKITARRGALLAAARAVAVGCLMASRCHWCGCLAAASAAAVDAAWHFVCVVCDCAHACECLAAARAAAAGWRLGIACGANPRRTISAAAPVQQLILTSGAGFLAPVRLRRGEELPLGSH